MNESKIFNAAVKLSAAERTKFLDLACKDNPALRGQVDALLIAHDDSQTFLGDSSEGKKREWSKELQETLDPRTTESAGTIIAGKYKLLDKPIGEGGMGTVWLAEQREPVKRLVALKLIKAGMDSKAVLARFEAERHALALMDHPNIARILDGGMTEVGSPFFVMELVKGVPITEFCDARKLTPQQRLELFIPVCQAIQHAHQKGIIHRDIKPSNVLVALYDDKPVPKVIDFGVAKATGQGLTEQTLNTGFNVVGTPQYMSPEQATFNQLDIDTRSDIYSLGVLLYELLAGSPPFKKQDLEKAGLLEILRVIREEEPPRPSTKASTAAGLPSISANRGIEPSKLTGLLRNELDWIVMKALEKDRARRYETANGFAADINRYLSGEAVLAHPPSKTYRLKKFLNKHKGPVLAASLIFFALLAGVIGTTLGLFEARAERGLADGQRDRAVTAEKETRARADELKMVSEFQAGMLAQVDPTEAGKLLSADVNAKFAEALAKANVPENKRASQISGFAEQWKRVNATDAARGLIDRTILQPAVAMIEKQFADQPVVDAQLRQTLAKRYRDLGLYDAALPLQKHALATRRRVLGEEHPSTLASISSLGGLLQDEGKLSEAEPFYREALEKTRRVLGEENANTLASINNFGGLLQDQGRLSEAERYYREALEKSRQVLGEEHPNTVTSIGNLGTLLEAQGKLSDAEPYFREAFEKCGRLLGEEHPRTLTSLDNLGFLLQSQGKLDEAEPCLRKALENRRRLLGEEHPDTLTSINNLGLLLQSQGKLSEAEPYYREAVEQRRRLLGEEHLDTLTSINNLGLLLQFQGKLNEAEPYLRETLENRRRVLGTEHPNTLISIICIGVLLQSQGKLSEAEPCLREALEKCRRVLGAEHPNTLTSINNLGSLLLAQGKLNEAEPYFREALEKCRLVLGDDHPDTLISISALGVLLHSQGKLDEAEPYYREALENRRRLLGDDHPDTLKSMASLAALYWTLKQFDKSVPMFDDVLKRQEAKLGREHPDTLHTVANLGVNYKDSGRLQDAIPLLEEAHTASRKMPTLDFVGTQLLDAYLKAGKTSHAAKLVQEQLAEARKTLPPDSPQLAGKLAQIGLTLLTVNESPDAEPILRECLAIRETTQPDEWTTFNTKSLLGGSLLGQKKYTAAEPLLLAGYEGMKEREVKIPEQGKERIPQALDRLIELYTAWHAAEPNKGYDAKAAAWQTKLDEFKAAAPGDHPTSTNKPKRP